MVGWKIGYISKVSVVSFLKVLLYTYRLAIFARIMLPGVGWISDRVGRDAVNSLCVPLMEFLNEVDTISIIVLIVH